MITRRVGIITLALLTLFAACEVCLAVVINNFPEENLWSGSIGENSYQAQTFKTLPGFGFATNLAIIVDEDYFGPAGVDFHLLITEVSGTGLDFHPTTVLFESTTITYDSAVGYTVLNIPLPDMAFVPFTTYAFIIDGYVTQGGLTGTAAIGLNGTYDGGSRYWVGSSSGTRTAHFQSDWYSAERTYIKTYVHDLAFQMSFTPIPEPASLSLLGLVSGGIYFTRRFFSA